LYESINSLLEATQLPIEVNGRFQILIRTKKIFVKCNTGSNLVIETTHMTSKMGHTVLHSAHLNLLHNLYSHFDR